MEFVNPKGLCFEKLELSSHTIYLLIHYPQDMEIVKSGIIPLVVIMVTWLTEVRTKDRTRICHKPAIGHDIHPRTIKPSHHRKSCKWGTLFNELFQARQDDQSLKAIIVSTPDPLFVFWLLLGSRNPMRKGGKRMWRRVRPACPPSHKEIPSPDGG